jgi:anti-sigma B factor antagonist
MGFSIEIKKDDKILNVTLKGSLINKQQIEGLMNELEFEFEQGFNKVIIDLLEMDYMNSTGLNILINILTLTRSKGGEVVIVNIPERIKKLLIITKLDSVFDIEDSIDDAKKVLT